MSEDKNSLLDKGALGNPATVRLAIAAGADVNARNEKGGTPLRYCSNPHSARLLIEAGADVNARDDKGDTPLHAANTLQSVKLLIEAGAEVDIKGEFGWTPLHNACMSVNHGPVDALIAAGADVGARDNDERTPLFYARTPLNARLLIAGGADVNAQNRDGWTPPFLANSPEMALVFLEAGADWRVKDREGQTMAQHHRRHQRIAVAEAIETWVAARQRSGVLNEQLDEAQSQQGPGL